MNNHISKSEEELKVIADENGEKEVPLLPRMAKDKLLYCSSTELSDRVFSANETLNNRLIEIWVQLSLMR